MRAYLSRLEDSADNRDVTGSIPVVRTRTACFPSWRLDGDHYRFNGVGGI